MVRNSYNTILFFSNNLLFNLIFLELLSEYLIKSYFLIQLYFIYLNYHYYYYYYSPIYSYPSIIYLHMHPQLIYINPKYYLIIPYLSIFEVLNQTMKEF